MANTIPVSELRSHLIDEVEQADGEPITVLKHGHPVAIVLSYTTHERLLDYIEDIEDELALLKARAEPDSVPLSELRNAV